MFGEEADGFGSGVEKEARDLANKPGQQRGKLRRYFFKPAGHSFSGRFQTIGKGSNNCTNSDASGKQDGCHGKAVFFEYFFDPFAERHGLFSFCDLGLQPRQLLESFFYSENTALP